MNKLLVLSVALASVFCPSQSYADDSLTSPDKTIECSNKAIHFDRNMYFENCPEMASYPDHPENPKSARVIMTLERAKTVNNVTTCVYIRPEPSAIGQVMFQHMACTVYGPTN